MSKTIPRWTNSFKVIGKHFNLFGKDKTKLVGQDHLGNQYFETYRPNHIRPTQRYHAKVKVLSNFDELVDTCHVPPAWDSWLRFRRIEPPSEKEVLEGEEYYKMQQDMANEKKAERSKISQPVKSPPNLADHYKFSKKQ